MKKIFKVLLGVLILSSAGLSMADERDHEGDRVGAKVIIVPAKHHYRRRRRVRVVHPAVEFKVGVGVHDNRLHYDHDYDNNWRARHRWNEERHDWDR